MKKAVFLDRDGVINPLVYNVSTGEYESPNYPEDFSVFTYVTKALKLLKKEGFINIIISNQPSVAKGKTTMQNIKKIEDMLCQYSEEHGNLLDAYYYCYHHPEGVVSEYAKFCKCRKPDTLFVQQAVIKYDLDINKSYLVGDQDTDIKCGNDMNLYTIKIINKYTLNKISMEQPNDIASNLNEAVEKIIKHYEGVCYECE